MRILVVIGTRPEAIKMLPLVLELRKYSTLETLVCFSGQHESLADEVFDYFNIAPDFVCRDTGKRERSLNELTRSLLNYFDVLFNNCKPDTVLVHGDTTTAFCAALSAFLRGIRIGHVEAGLRTYNVRSPYPEEFNRVAIDAMSDLHFAPTAENAKSLEKEGKSGAFVVGNTVIDALEYTLSDTFHSSLIDEAGDRKILLVTTHRRENIGEKMQASLLGVRDILCERGDLFAILPAHPNPAVRRVIYGVFSDVKNIKICEPLAVREFHNILARSLAVITDSGGVQEEASYLGVPIFLLRDTTERAEAVASGNARLVGCKREEVRREILKAISDEHILSDMKRRSLAFGDGTASKKIAKKLLSLS